MLFVSFVAYSFYCFVFFNLFIYDVFWLWWVSAAACRLSLVLGGAPLVAVCELVIAVAPLLVERGLWVSGVAALGLGSCGLQAQERCLRSLWATGLGAPSTWELPGIKPVSLALQGGFLTT